MFREMRRFKQQLDAKQCQEVLRTQKRGVLSLLGDGGYPYGIPLNHWYCEEDGRLYFHGAKAGHKIDALKRNNKVSYCVYDEGYVNPGEWAKHVKSVIVFGKIEFIEDEAKAKEICSNIVRKFTGDEEYLENELKLALSRVQCLVLVPEHMTGKLVKES